MSDKLRDITTITFSGPRFEDAGLELDVLPELLVYRKILIETAKELWRDANRGLRLPRGFRESIRLKFYSIEMGSAAVPVKQVIQRDDSLPSQHIQDDGVVQESALLIDQTIVAASEGRAIPDRMPKRALLLFAEFGKKLREGESIKTRSTWSANAAEFTLETRRRFESLREGASGLDTVTPATYSVDPGYFEIRDSAVATPARLLPAAEEEMADETFDDSAPPLWQAVIDLGASLPPEEWDRVPDDLAANLDHYLYGSTSDE